MKPRRTTFTRGGTWILFSLLLLAWASLGSAEEIEVPNWKLKCADGSRVDFHEALGEGPVLVSYWALWCKPCLKELPYLDKLSQDFKGKLRVFAVNIDSPKSVAKVRPYLKSKGYKFEVPLDTSGDTCRLMQVGNAVPFLVLYDSDGSEVYKHTGYKEGDEKELRKHVEELLGGGEGEAATEHEE